jgi:eukaryotic-like serine/threonine-protein kinase
MREWLVNDSTFRLHAPGSSVAGDSGPPTGWVPVQPWHEIRPDEPPGFALKDIIGSGGMGVVYRAQDLLLSRDVAVKLLHTRFADDPAASARFFEEACITAQLQHPGVPAVYHAGATPSGRPFLAMKLIVGETLHTILRDAKPINALAVFEAICQAVGYAHSRGVIHRDLKPGNIMVGAFGEVQVMDWGIAKVLQSPSQNSVDTDTPAPVGVRPTVTAFGPSTPHTLKGSAVGTPAYMSPEQASGETERITRRSDVFGLGGLLCVLLTGKPPFDGDDTEAVRAASARGDMDAAYARLDACHAEPDVIALCKRCLSVDPAERPEDAGTVATEVAALRAATEERARRAELDVAEADVRVHEQARRRRMILWAATTISLVLCLGLAGVVAGLVDARDSRKLAEAALSREAEERRHAETSAAEALASKTRTEAALTFTEDILAFARPAGQDRGLGVNVTLRQAIDAAVKKLDGLFPNDPLTEVRIRQTLAVSYENLGYAEGARSMAERIVTLLSLAQGPDHPQTRTAQIVYAKYLLNRGRYEEAMKLAEEVVPRIREQAGPTHPRYFKSLATLASATHVMGRLEDARVLRQEIHALSTTHLGADHPDTLRYAQELASSLSSVGRQAEALTIQKSSVELIEAKLGPDHPDTLVALQNLASRHFTLDQLEDCLKLNLRVQASSRTKLGHEHPFTLRSADNLANCLTALNRNLEAVELRQKNIIVQKRVLGPEHPDVITSLFNLASNFSRLDRMEDAVKTYLEVRELSRAKHGLDHPSTLMTDVNLGHTLRKLKREKEAIPILEDAVKRMIVKLPVKHVSLYWGTFHLCSCYIAVGQAPKATVAADAYLTMVAGQGVNPKWVAAVLGVRNEDCSNTNDALECRKTAEIAEAFGHTGLDELHDYAGYRAIAAAAWDASGNRFEAEADAIKSMKWLHKAVAAGLKEPARLLIDNDLKFLRSRPDFQELIASMRKAKP